ncbi:phage tail protein [Anaerococcus murdochii]|uniref:Phage tail protein n=1 Tax=Anaerococcus murdochii TaxID=411577 RepID=A0ABS7SYS6_9FIRM|nr:phage tail protein [Anaerococcus murdochii]MBZ2386690.1 phage tail protein [Anaerococcus murdochii]
MILLLDKNEELSRSIDCYDITRTRELNGENTLETESSEEILEGDRIVFKDGLAKWREYIISSVDIERDEEVKYIAYGEDSSYELFYTYVDDLKPRNELAKSILGRLLEDTRFEVGFVEDVGRISTNFYHTNVRNCLYRIVESLGCEIDYRIEVRDSKVVGRYVDLYKKMGSNNGKRFTYRKDLNNIKKTIDYSTICSKLYGYGKGEEIVDEERDISEEKMDDKDSKYGRRINFADVNGGKKYVENNDTRLKYGIGLERKHLEGVFVAEDCEDKEELLRLTKEELEKRSKPKISYDINVEDISKYQDMGGIVEGVGLGDEVLISDKSINEKVLTRVIKIVDHPFTGEDMDITLGNYFLSLTDSIVETERLKRLIENRDRLIGEEIKRLATMTNKGFLRSVADRLNRELNNTDGFVYFIPDKGIRVYDKPIEQNPTKCIELGGGHLRIANKKLPNGEFDFTSFGTGDGFTASLIVAGILKGGKVEFDLENGTFLIGESINNFSMYWDGKTLKLRNVDIDLSNNSQISNIENKVKNIQQDFKIGQGSLESKIRSLDSNYNSLSSRITQTNNKIESEISSVKSTASSNYSSLSSRIRQTESSIETKVSSSEARSIFKQEASSFTFDARQVNFNSDVNISGTFETEGSTYDGRASSKIRVKDGAIQFWDKSTGEYSGQMYAYDKGIHLQAGRNFGVWAGRVVINSSGEMYLNATEKMNLYPYGGLDINGSSNFKRSVTFYNSIYFDSSSGDWRIAVTNDGQQLFIIAPNGKRWNFDKYSGFFSKD